jgi:DNA invertase Pin-like site-specific DNA recombinase
MAVKYAKGATCHALAAEYGCKRTTVANRLRKHGVRMRKSSPEPQDIEKFIEMYEAGASINEIVRKTGFARRTIQRYLSGSGTYRRGPYNMG